MYLIRLLPLALLALAGCATKRPAAPAAAPVAKPEIALARVIPMGNPKHCSLILYRAKTKYLNNTPSQPVLFVGHQQISPIKAGDTLCVEIIDGMHTLAIQERDLFSPRRFSWKTSYTFPRAQPIYLQYSKAYLRTGQNFTREETADEFRKAMSE